MKYLRSHSYYIRGDKYTLRLSSCLFVGCTLLPQSLFL